MEDGFGDGPDIEEGDSASEKLSSDIMTPMGITSENVASTFSISRERQDSFAASSHQKASQAQA
eukprot:CAMPEP_0197566692 /NCGR_PEP_ID=MMETSP1320-20131121/34307_1 /TAXON_ID=91990 /ORGANISM="Bolidomonas sp., Strain RCC2347" /LENGTH=63 /DNA_ID=CAMNT_0043128807 /DNA_START=16 /DNA_END=203 /DNA_ORIENTATION=+